MAKKRSGACPLALLDQLLAGHDTRTLLESDGLMGELKQSLAHALA